MNINEQVRKKNILSLLKARWFYKQTFERAMMNTLLQYQLPDCNVYFRRLGNAGIIIIVGFSFDIISSTISTIANPFTQSRSNNNDYPRHHDSTASTWVYSALKYYFPPSKRLLRYIYFSAELFKSSLTRYKNIFDTRIRSISSPKVLEREFFSKDNEFETKVIIRTRSIIILHPSLLIIYD